MNSFYLAQFPHDQTAEALGVKGLLWGARGIPGQPGACILHVPWDGRWPEREAFESRADVLSFGAPWEPLHPAAVAALEAFRQSVEPLRKAKGLPATTPIDATHTLHQALRKAWPDFQL